MLHYCCDGLTDHFKNPFFSFTSYASAVLGPPDGLEALGASAGASVGLDADADLLGASELDVEELAPSAKGATATAVRRITTSTRARAMAYGRESWCLGLRGCELWRLCFGAGHCVLCSWRGHSGCFIRETGAYFWMASWGRVALACLGLWHLARRGACPMRTRPFLESTGGVS